VSNPSKRLIASVRGHSYRRSRSAGSRPSGLGHASVALSNIAHCIIEDGLAWACHFASGPESCAAMSDRIQHSARSASRQHLRAREAVPLQ